MQNIVSICAVFPFGHRWTSGTVFIASNVWVEVQWNVPVLWSELEKKKAKS